MPLKALSLFVIVFAGLLFSCSLTTMNPVRTLRIQLPSELRDEPLLSQMSHFAIAVSGGVANSLSASQVGNRSLDCLNLIGQVFFPYTLNQLLSGASISLNQGSYRFTIIAFANGVGSPTTVAALYSGSSSLKAYVVAQGQVDTRTAASATLTSTYLPASASDLLVTCPVASQRYHGLFVSSTNLSLYSFDGSGWSYSSIGEAFSKLPGLFVDASGYVHVSYTYFNAAFEKLKYLSNTTGTFVEEVVVSSTSGTDPTAIAQTSNGSIYILSVTPASSPNMRLIRRAAPNNWVQETDVLYSSGFTQAILRAGPSNTLLAAAASGGGNPVVVAAAGTGGGAFGTTIGFTSAGLLNCSAGTDLVAGGIDNTERAHIVYRCQVTADFPRLGYANNSQGFGTSKVIATATTADMRGVAFDIDPDGGLHAAYSDGNSVYYLKGNSLNGIWGAPELAFQNGSLVNGVALAARSGTDIQITVNLTNGNAHLTPVSNRTGSWLASNIIYNGFVTPFSLLPVLTSR